MRINMHDKKKQKYLQATNLQPLSYNDFIIRLNIYLIEKLLIE